MLYVKCIKQSVFVGVVHTKTYCPNTPPYSDSFSYKKNTDCEVFVQCLCINCHRNQNTHAYETLFLSTDV